MVPNYFGAWTHQKRPGPSGTPGQGDERLPFRSAHTYLHLERQRHPHSPPEMESAYPPYLLTEDPCVFGPSNFCCGHRGIAGDHGAGVPTRRSPKSDFGSTV
jgi:hypothetical protein